MLREDRGIPSVDEGFGENRRLNPTVCELGPGFSHVCAARGRTVSAAHSITVVESSVYRGSVPTTGFNLSTEVTFTPAPTRPILCFIKVEDAPIRAHGIGMRRSRRRA